jgi:SAM-dependent methyltransferase
MLTYEFIDPNRQITSKDFEFVESFLNTTNRTQLGWHYITDITWIYSNIKEWPRNYKVLDAGGGFGPLQFLLAEIGFSVVNIDLVLAKPPQPYVNRYKTTHETFPSFIPTGYINLLDDTSNSWIETKLKRFLKSSSIYQIWRQRKYKNYEKSHDQWRSSLGIDNVPIGTIEWKTGNLCHMPEVPSGSFDAVVSLSAWEHIPYEILSQAISEIRRVLKPEAKWAVTTSGTEKSETWWHEPSQSNCFSADDLVTIFQAHSSQNQIPEIILDSYRDCEYLKDNIANFYKKSGKYGMPWGIWDPKYIPVGLSK